SLPSPGPWASAGSASASTPSRVAKTSSGCRSSGTASCESIWPRAARPRATSRWKEGKPRGGVTYRGGVWLDVAPDRSGLLPALWKRGSRFEDYVEWALDVPMFLFKRGGHAIANTGQTFRSFMKSGSHGCTPNMEDWKTHLNTLFPE